MELSALAVSILLLLSVYFIGKLLLDRKHWNREFAQSEERYHTLMEQASDAIFLADSGDNFLEVNPNACALLGYSKDELLRLSIKSLIPPEELAADPIRTDELRRGTAITKERRLRRKDQTVVSVEMKARILPDGRLQAIVRDTRQRKQAESLLRESEERYRNLVELSPDAIAVHCEGKIVFVNTAALRLTRASSAEEILGKSVIDFVHPDSRELVRNRIQWILSEGMPASPIEETFLRLDGSSVEVEVVAMPFHWQGKQAIQVIVRDISRRKQTEQALWESERFSKTVVSSVGEGIIVYDRELRYRAWNTFMEELTGVSAKEILGRYAPNILPHLKAQGVEALLRRALAGETVTSPDTFYRVEKTGKTGWVVGTYSPHSSATGEILGVVGVVRDITDRKVAEEKLRESEQHFRTLVEQSSDAIYVLQDDRLALVNSAWERLFGYSAEEVFSAGFDYLKLVAPESQAFILDRRGRSKRGEELPRRYEMRGVTKDGRVIDLEVSVATVPWRGRPAIQGFYRDITERKNAEEKIREQAALLDKAQDAISVRDLDGKILYWNHAAEQLYGYTQPEVVGKNVADLFYHKLPTQFDSAMKAVLSEGEWTGELEHLTKGRKKITVESRWTLIYHNDGKPRSILVINTDVTEKKQLQAQLLRAQRMQSIGTLAGGIAHDLNNALTPVLMAVSLIKTRIQNEELFPIIHTIETSAQQTS